MDEPKQVLDVSYGTFSCRLEGFEDSVETMKTIVAYFHDLAGHDRFMDLEPQAPDMETLARLTEEQAGVPVELEGEGQNVSLRALPAETEAEEEDEDLAAALEALDEDEEEDEFADDDDVVAAEFAEDDSDIAEESAEVAAEEHDEDEDDIDDMIEASVADKLQRIKDVVGAGAALRHSYDASADEMPEGFAAEETEDDTANLAATEDAADLEADDDTAEVAETDDAIADESFEEVEEEVAEVSEAEVAEEAPAPAAPVHDPAKTRILNMDEMLDPSDFDDQLMPQEDQKTDVAEEEDAPAAETPAEDAPAAEGSGPLVLTSSDAAIGQDTPAPAATDDDEEFDLQAEVAKIEAELAARKGNSMARHGLPRSVDDAMSRILSQTDQHLNQPESRRHRDAFAQLKAAVAATEAARQLGDQGESAEDLGDRFKDDLGAHDAEERADATPAPKAPPLKLVETSRVHEPEETAPPAPAPAAAAPEQPSAQPQDAASARLREIAARKESAGEIGGTTGFKEFAQEQGADEIIDLIEAAAAYMYYVEGEADFSRPQVMKKVQTATGREISREDGLRAFGRLLRMAKIVKLSNGRFRVSESSDYRPDNARAAQG